eukprot:6890159-Prymnesium_polylepis.1
MVVPGRSRVRAKLPRARGAAGEQSAHGAVSPGMHCLVAAPNAGAAVANSPARGRCRLASKEAGGGRRPSCDLQYDRPIRR